MAEQRRQRHDIDTRRRETILEGRIRNDTGRTRHRLDALERHQRELRVRGRQALMSQQRICDAPAVMQLSQQVFDGNDDIVEKYLAEFLIAHDRLDRSDPDAGAVQINQQETDAGVSRLSLRIGADEREHPVRVMCPGRPNLMPPHHEMIARERCPGRQAGEVGARAGLGIALRPDHGARNDGRQMLRLLCGGPELHEDGADMIETLSRQMRRADARHLLGHDELFVERGAHSAILLRPVRRDPAFARERAIPGHELRRRRTRCAAPKRERKIGFQPGPYFHAELGFDGGITTEHGEEFDADAGERYRAEGRKTHSTLMLAAFTTAVHCASSLASNLPNSAGVPILISAPSVASRARVSGWARLSRNAALSLSMMAGRVPAGATTPSQNGACSLGQPASGVVGTSGNFEKRSAPAIASARRFPDWMWGRLLVAGSAMI